VPNGVEEVFFEDAPSKRGEWLIITASILPVKRLLQTLRGAIIAKVPIWVIGAPFTETDEYYLAFLKLAKSHPNIIRYEGPIYDRSKLGQIYREARGFVLLSKWESQSISALEAAATRCPLLLSDLPWARYTFGNNVRYCPVTEANDETAEHLRKFYDDAPELPLPDKPKNWLEVAESLNALYRSLL
jgi:glycosyltransferase involved in cell wall biosynthesis